MPDYLDAAKVRFREVMCLRYTESKKLIKADSSCSFTQVRLDIIFTEKYPSPENWFIILIILIIVSIKLCDKNIKMYIWTKQDQ